MIKKKSNNGPLFVIVYYMLAVAALLFAYWSVTTQPGKSEFVGVYPVVVTAPWSMIIMEVLDAFRIKTTATGDILLYALCTIPNAIIIYKIGNK